jgi:hypothetical protein
MPLPWPSFWQHIREEDRGAISEILTGLLAHGALLGDQGRDRELFQLAREYQREIGEYLAPLHLELMPDPDQPILQVRPVPGDCGLMARFDKAETLLVLTLWRMYHDARMEQIAGTVVVTLNEIWHRLRLYFERIDPPTEAHLRTMLGRLRNRRLVRIQWHDDTLRSGESQVEILPTLSRAIPFENVAAWEQQVTGFQSQPVNPETAVATPDNAA